MKALNHRATLIFKTLISSLKEGYVKIDNASGTFMPVSFERLETVSGLMGVNMDLYSLAHYYEQNGDLIADPEMTFFVYDNDKNFMVFPASYRQDGLGIYQESIFNNGSWKVSPKMQTDHTVFANMWLNNIKNQQNV